MTQGAVPVQRPGTWQSWVAIARHCQFAEDDDERECAGEGLILSARRLSRALVYVN